MSYYSVDVESDNPTPASGNLVSFGAVKVTPDFNETFYCWVAPKTGNDYIHTSAFEVARRGIDENYPQLSPIDAMISFKQWIDKTCTNGRPIFISDNPAYDYMWIAYYFDMVNMKNPFGHSARRISDIFCGYNKDLYYKWKYKYRETKHTHNPVDDAKGNAEAFLKLMKEMEIKIK